MKSVKRLAVLVCLLASLSPVANAGCLQQFRDGTAGCDTLGGFFEMGCRLDETVEYYRCLGRAATS